VAIASPIEQRWALLASHREHLLAYAQRRCSSDADAEDCVQEALLRAATFERLDETRIGAFLRTVTGRLVIDAHRRRQRDLRLLAHRRVHDAATSPEEMALGRLTDQDVAGAVQRLPSREREVVAARVAGLSTAEIAELLGVTPKSVERGLARARGHLRHLGVSAMGLLLLLVRRLRTAQHTVALDGIALASVVAVSGAFGPAVTSDGGDGNPSAAMQQPAAVQRHQPAGGDRGPAPAATFPAATGAPISRSMVGTGGGAGAGGRVVVGTGPVGDQRLASSGPAGVSRHKEHESFVETLTQCLQPGQLAISPSYVGCR
jgi:RNA polymerase sigma-70 factor (ECF subfamily)